MLTQDLRGPSLTKLGCRAGGKRKAKEMIREISPDINKLDAVWKYWRLNLKSGILDHLILRFYFR